MSRRGDNEAVRPFITDFAVQRTFWETFPVHLMRLWLSVNQSQRERSLWEF